MMIPTMIMTAVTILMTMVSVMTAVTILMVMMSVVIVMVAAGIWIKFQRALRQRLCRCVSGPFYTGVELDARVSQRHLRPHTDASADQGIDLCRLKEAGEGPVSVPIRVYYLLVYNVASFGVVQLKMFGMPEMLKDFSVFIRNCNSH